MEYFDQLNELKRLILAKLGIRFITPADCKRISIEISKHLNKNVSETTIKRLFGFAVVKHKFSTFTLTTLAEYVDMVGEVPTILEKEVRDVTIADDWTSLRDTVNKITQFTLKTIRNRSGIPYEMTIGRKFAEHDFDEFYKGDQIFTCLISQPGYGKTILLSHLTETLFLQPEAPYHNSSVLFIKAYSFFNKESINVHIEEQLKTHLQLDIQESALTHIDNLQEKHGGKFLLIIDGFADLILNKEDKNILYDNLINLICSLEDCKNIKLMLSLRSTSWIRFFDRMRHSSFLKAKWFPGNYFNLHELSNVPPLSEKEVDTIMSKINYLDNKEINPRLKSQLKFPFHIQLYYQLKEEDPDFNYYTNITFYELVSRYIQEKIYRSNYYTEKILFLKKIIQLTGYGIHSNAVEKDSLLAELSAFRNAYMELLSDGILMEEKRSKSSHPQEFVRFAHPHMFEYFLFVEILEKFHLQVNKDFFTYINTEYDFNQVRFQLLQWSTRFLVKTGNFAGLRAFFKLNLSSFENNYLILFIAEEIKYRAKYNADIIRILEEDKFHETVISKLINFDFIDSCYTEAVHALIEITKNEEHLSIYHSLLGFLKVLRLDKEGIKDTIAILSPMNTTGWKLNPLEVFQSISAKLDGKPLVSNGLLKKIEGFIDGTNTFTLRENHQIDMRNAISYIMMILVHSTVQDNVSVNQIIQQIIKLNPKEMLRKGEFAMSILTMGGLNLSKTAPGRKVDQMENILVALLNRPNSIITKFQESILMMFQAQQAYNRKEYDLALHIAKECIELFKRNDVVLNAIAVYNLVIKIYSDMENYTLMNEFKFEKLCLLDEQQLSRQLF